MSYKNINGYISMLGGFLVTEEKGPYVINEKKNSVCTLACLSLNVRPPSLS